MRSGPVTLVVAWLALSASAAAQSAPSAELDWEGLEQLGCLPSEVARAEVRERLERDPFATVEGGASFRVTVRARREAGGLSVVFRMQDRDGRELGERELRSRGSDCRALDRSLVLALALMIESPAARATIYLPPAPPERIEPPRRQLRPREPRVAAFRVGIEAATDAFAGWLAPLTAGASLSVGLESRAGVSVHARAHGLSSVALADARVDILAMRFEVGACVLASASSRLAIGGCVDGGASVVHARGHGLGDPRTVWTAVPDVVASARAELSLGRAWSLAAELGASVILVRPRFEVGEGGSRETTWEPWPVSPFLRVAVVVRPW